MYSPTFVVGGGAAWNEEYFWAKTELWKDEKQRRWLIDAAELDWHHACEKVGVSGVNLYQGTKHSRATRSAKV